MRVRPLLVALLLLAGALPCRRADDAQLARGIQAVRRMRLPPGRLSTCVEVQG